MGDDRRGGLDERRSVLAPPAVRLHHHLPLPVPPADDGAGASSSSSSRWRALRTGERALRRRRALLGPHLRHQLRRRRGHRHPDGVPVRDQLGALLQLRRRGHRPDAGDGGHVRLLPRVAPSWGSSCSARSGSRRGAPRRPRIALCRRHLALRLLHHRHQRLHAAPGRHVVGPDGRLELGDFWAFLLNPWALLAVLAQHDRRGGDRRRSSWPRSAPSGPCSGRFTADTRGSALRIGVTRRAGRIVSAGLSHRRPAGKAAWRRSSR